MNSSQEIIRELEIKRRALNERLMNAKDVAEANGIERELWALRTAIRHHQRRLQDDRSCLRLSNSATGTENPELSTDS